MNKSQSRIRQLANNLVWWFPALILGLFCGRIISEWFLPPWPVAILITLVTVAISIFFYRGRSYSNTWPLILFLLYVLYPYPDPKVALTIACLILILLTLLDPKRKYPDSLRKYLPANVLAGLLISLATLTLYLFTLAPGILPADSGEFQLVATKLGLAHPPGFPLYTMLAHLMTLLPLDISPAVKVNLFSALTSTTAILMVYLTVKQLTNSIIAGLISAAMLGISTTFWSQATTANIRSFTVLFTAILFFVFLKITRSGSIINHNSSDQSDSSQNKVRFQPSKGEQQTGIDRILFPIFVLVLVSGISHHASLLFIGLLLLLFLIGIEWNQVRQTRQWLFMLIAGVIALLPLLYLPIRGAEGAIGSPQDITTTRGFINHVLALGFSGDFFYFIDSGLLWDRLRVMINVMTFQFQPLTLLLMLAGFILLALRDKTLALVLGGAFALHTIISAIYRAPQTVEYMLPAYVPAVILLGYFVGAMDTYRRRYGRGGRNPAWQLIASSLLISFGLVLIVIQFRDNYASYRQLHESHDTRDYVQPLLEEAPREAVILADWHWVTPLRYLQEIEGLRRDLQIRYVFPTSEAYLDTWRRRIEEQLSEGKEVIATRYNEAAYQSLPLAQPFDEAVIFTRIPTMDLPVAYQPLSLNLNDSIQVLGIKQADHSVVVGEETVIHIAWQPTIELNNDASLYIHLVGQDGRVYAQDDIPARAQEKGLTISQFRLAPRPVTNAGTYSLALGLTNPKLVQDSSPPARYSVSQIKVDIMQAPLITLNPTYRPLVSDKARSHLIGYDWDNTIDGTSRLYLTWQTNDGYISQVEDILGSSYKLPDLIGPWGFTQRNASIEIDKPATYIPLGQGILLTSDPLVNDSSTTPGQDTKYIQRFTASIPVFRDLIVSLRLVGYEDDGFHWAWWDLNDGVPALGAIPTLKWIGSSEVNDPRWLKVDDEARPGQQIEPLLRLYDAFSSRPLPILDERITEVTPWIPLGRSTIAE